MNSLVFVFAALALFGVHLLRPGQTAGRLVAVASFGLGLAAAMLAVKVAMSAAGLGRTTDFDRVVNHAVAVAAAEPGAPLIVFTGASYSRNALDDARITRRLREAGFPHRVINLSLEAASLPEREAHLDAFLQRVGRVPDLVFIEVAAQFDMRPAQFFNNSKFSTRGIEQFDLRTSAWTGLGLAQGECESATACAKEAGFTLAHFALNALNIGLVARGEDPATAGEMASFDPQVEVREETTEAEQLAGLRAGPDFTPRPGPLWIASLRAQLDRRLERLGVREVGYYFPPVIEARERAYVDGLCLGGLAGAPCFPPSDPQLLAALEGDVWFDSYHLLADGADIYSDWLAGRLISSGLLEHHGISETAAAGSRP